MAQLPISVNDAEKEINAQIAEKGLNVITSKMIRKHLEAKFNCHLDGFKNEIDGIIESCIICVTNTSNLKAVNKEDPESDTTDSHFDFPSSTSTVNNGKKKTGAGAKRQRAQIVDESEAVDLATAVKRRRSANQTAPKKRTQKKDVDKKGGNRKRNSAFSKICVISYELSTLLGKSYMRRSDVVKEMWAYFRSKNLLDPKNKQFVILDEPLKRVFGQKARIKAFGMMSDLKKYVKDVAMLDVAARAKAEADIAEILAMEEENNNELDKEDDDEEGQEQSMATNHSVDITGNSVIANSSTDCCTASPMDGTVHIQQPSTTEHQVVKEEQPNQMGKNASDDSSEEEEEDSGSESSSDSDSD